MSDNLDNRGPRDANLISLTEDWEVKYWSKALACSVMELTAAVKAVGHSAKAVREHLKKN